MLSKYCLIFNNFQRKPQYFIDADAFTIIKENTHEQRQNPRMGPVHDPRKHHLGAAWRRPKKNTSQSVQVVKLVFTMSLDNPSAVSLTVTAKPAEYAVTHLPVAAVWPT